MKLIRVLFALMLTLLGVSCGSTSGYDAGLCDEIARKIAMEQTLTQADYAAMIEQVGFMDEEFGKLYREAGDDEEAYQKLMGNEHVANMMGYTSVFTTVLSFTDQLDEKNTEAWDRLQQRFEVRDGF